MFLFLPVWKSSGGQISSEGIHTPPELREKEGQIKGKRLKKYISNKYHPSKMFFCRDCGKQFRDTYNLTKHMSRVRPCTPTRSNGIRGGAKNESLEELNDSQVELNDSQKMPRSSHGELKDSGVLCQFCLQTFSIKTNMKKHHLTCKCKEDPVRLLEIEKGIDVDIPENKLECRFCNCIFSKTSNLNRHISSCKDREKYIKHLQTPVNCTINNYNNNTTNNYNNVNVNFIIGEEKMTKYGKLQLNLFVYMIKC
jgi:hypothetical protein